LYWRIFFSNRFGKNVWVTRHARESMLRRKVDADTLKDRADNLICAAVVEQAALIVKTVMINWELEDET